jgi:nucleotide-binding universal stress UspA family protein
MPALKTILVSTDGSEQSDGAIREAIRLAKGCSSLLYAVSVVETNPEYEALAPGLVEKAGIKAKEHLDSVKGRALAEGVSCSTLIRHGEEPYKLIVEEAEGKGADLIVMGRRGRRGLKRAVMGSVTASVIGHAGCNVLVVPKEAELGFRRLLVATDGSRWSEAAAAAALGLARSSGSSVTIISVVPSESAEPLDIVHSGMQRELIAEKELGAAEKNARRIRELAEKEGVKARAYVMAGRPFEAILGAAEEDHADLIVMGSHGRTGLEKLLMGSVTERVITLSGRAVLVVKAK